MKINNNLFYITLLVFFIASGLFSCKKTRKEPDLKEAHELFLKTIDLYNDRIIKISHSKDSDEMNKYIIETDNMLTRLNYEFSPDTDLLLSEQENDSIYKLYLKFIETKEAKGRELEKLSIDRDSL